MRKSCNTPIYCGFSDFHLPENRDFLPMNHIHRNATTSLPIDRISFFFTLDSDYDKTLKICD